MPNQLIREPELLEIVRVKSRTLRDLRERKVIPFYKAGDRTFLYDPEEVMTALRKFRHSEVKIPEKREKKSQEVVAK
jgi:hypothetical protein